MSAALLVALLLPQPRCLPRVANPLSLVLPASQRGLRQHCRTPVARRRTDVRARPLQQPQRQHWAGVSAPMDLPALSNDLSMVRWAHLPLRHARESAQQLPLVSHLARPRVRPLARSRLPCTIVGCLRPSLSPRNCARRRPARRSFRSCKGCLRCRPRVNRMRKRTRRRL